MSETHLSTPISQTFALIAGDCNTAESVLQLDSAAAARNAETVSANAPVYD